MVREPHPALPWSDPPHADRKKRSINAHRPKWRGTELWARGNDMLAYTFGGVRSNGSGNFLVAPHAGRYNISIPLNKTACCRMKTAKSEPERAPCAAYCGCAPDAHLPARPEERRVGTQRRRR